MESIIDAHCSLQDESDEDEHRNDPTWRDVLYEKRAKRQQSRGFVEWSIQNRAASMIQVRHVVLLDMVYSPLYYGDLLLLSRCTWLLSLMVDLLFQLTISCSVSLVLVYTNFGDMHISGLTGIQKTSAAAHQHLQQ